MREALELPIVGRKEVAAGTLEILLGLEGKHFEFVAGQYMRVTIIDPLYDDARENWREFSIASSPNEKKYLQFACRVSDSGFKKNLEESLLGTKVRVEGPFGVFTLPKDSAGTLVCIAGGIGVTPFLSMTTFAAEEQLPQKMVLLYANNSPETAAYAEELRGLEKTNPNFTLKEKVGLLDGEFISESTKECSGSSCSWYLAGPPGMVGAARKILLERGIEEKSIRIEEFSHYYD